MILNKEIEEHIVLEMRSSWNFPAQASPSYEGSELSQAELGNFNFRAETELKFFQELQTNFQIFYQNHDYNPF